MRAKNLIIILTIIVGNMISFPAQCQPATPTETPQNATSELLGTYTLYRIFNEQKKIYEVPNNENNHGVNYLIMTPDTLKMDRFSCSNMKYKIIPLDAKSMNINIILPGILKPLGIELLESELIEMKGDDCGMAAIRINKKYFFILTHEGPPSMIFIKK